MGSVYGVKVKGKVDGAKVAVDIEHLYQAFKARLLSEVRLSDVVGNTPTVEAFNQEIRRQVESSSDSAAPHVMADEDFEREEHQTGVISCATCGADVQVSKANELRDCPACAGKYKLVNKQVEPELVTDQEKVLDIVLCHNCGAPGPRMRMTETGCFRCDPEMMAKAMMEVG